MRRVAYSAMSARRLLLSAFLAATLPLSAQIASSPEMPPAELVRAAVKNEVAAAHETARHMFRARRNTPKGAQTRLYVETNDAIAALLIANGDQPLSADQHRAEMNHLAWLMGNPAALRRKQAREKEDAEHTLQIVRALPDAFRYEYAGTEQGTDSLGKTGDQLVRLKFSPNPSYSPPSRVEQVLEGMNGYLLIDQSARRLARIDGTLFKEVSFGWGIIGHLDKGGHFMVQQADVGDGTWDISRMTLNITGKILMFKSLSMISDETFTDFRRVPDHLSFAQGVDMLKAEEEKLARDAHAASSQKAPN